MLNHENIAISLMDLKDTISLFHDPKILAQTPNIKPTEIAELSEKITLTETSTIVSSLGKSRNRNIQLATYGKPSPDQRLQETFLTPETITCILDDSYCLVTRGISPIRAQLIRAAISYILQPSPTNVSSQTINTP